MRTTLWLTLALAACAGSSDDKTDTDTPQETDVTDTDDTTGGGDTDDTTGGDTDDTTGGDTDDTDVASEAVITFEADFHVGANYADALTADEITVECGSDGYGLGYTARFGTGTFVRVVLPWLTEGTQSVGYVPFGGFLFRLPSGTNGAIEDLGLQGQCFYTVTAPSGLGGQIDITTECSDIGVQRDGRRETLDFDMTLTVDGTTCNEPSTMASCDDAFEASVAECYSIPAEFCEDFTGCSVGVCDIDYNACTAYTDVTTCNATAGCDWDFGLQECTTLPDVACESVQDETDCGNEPGCTWDPTECTGFTTCSELEEAACWHEFECTPSYP